MVFLLLCITLAFVAISQPARTKFVREPASATKETNASQGQTASEGTITEFDSFNVSLENSNREQLVEMLSSIQLNRTEMLPIQIKKSEQRIAIAEKILKNSTDNIQIGDAKALLLDVMRESQQILFSENLEHNEAEIERLRKLVQNTQSSSNLNTKKAALITKAFLQSVEVSLNPLIGGNADEPLDQIKQTIAAAAAIDMDNAELALKLIYIINELGRKNIDNSELVRTFWSAYKQSTEPSIMAVTQKASQELMRREFQLDPLTASLLAKSKSLADTHSREIKGLITQINEHPSVEGNYWKLASSFALVAQSVPEVAETLADQLDGFMNSQQAPERARYTFQKMRSAIGCLHKRFPVQEVKCHEKSQDIEIVSDSKPTFLFIVESDTIEKSRAELLSFEKSFSELLRRDKMEFVVLLLDDQTNPSHWQRLTQITKLTPDCTSVWLNAESSKRFRELVPVPWSPTWMLIDGDQILRRVNNPSPLMRAEIVNFISS